MSHEALNWTHWVGGGAAATGLSGRLAPGELTGFMIGWPVNQLGAADAELVVSRSPKVNGFNVGLVPPKAYSAMAAVAGPALREAMLRCHVTAVTKAA